MNAIRPARKDARKTLIYVYGVARAAPERQLTALPRQGIVRNSHVRGLACGDLVAFGSAVPASQFGTAELRSSLADTKWLRDRILAHERVLRQLRSFYDVVPFRFCTIYCDPAQASRALTRHRTQLNEALDRVSGASEWTVKLYCDLAILSRWVGNKSGAMRKLREAVATASPGTKFFLRKKWERALDAEVAAAIATCIRQTDRNLAACARQRSDISNQSRDVHGRPQEMVANTAYLVEQGAVRSFQRVVAAQQAKLAPRGFSFELGGPWPPYHFVSAPVTNKCKTA